jgi:hypothetical protein
MIEHHINLGTCPQLYGDWRALKGISGCGFYFAMCERIYDDYGEEFRIFWYRHDQRFERWFRTPPFPSFHDAENEMDRIKRDIEQRGNANRFIEKVSSWRRGKIQMQYNNRLERRAARRAEQAMLKLPTYGLF